MFFSSSVPRHPPLFHLQFTFLCLVLGFAEAARGIVLPTLSLYVASLGGSALLLSIIVAAFSVGRLVSSVVFGVMNDYGVSLVATLCSSLCITVLGHILFILAGNVGAGAAGLSLLVVSRALTGFGTGILSVSRAFVSKQTAAAERTRYMARLGIVQFVGYAFTPALGGVTVNLGAINTYNAGTYALLIIDTVLGVVLWFSFRGTEETEEQQQTTDKDTIKQIQDTQTQKQTEKEDQTMTQTQPQHSIIQILTTSKQHRGYEQLTEPTERLETEAQPMTQHASTDRQRDTSAGDLNIYVSECCPLPNTATPESKHPTPIPSPPMSRRVSFQSPSPSPPPPLSPPVHARSRSETQSSHSDRVVSPDSHRRASAPAIMDTAAVSRQRRASLRVSVPTTPPFNAALVSIRHLLTPTAALPPVSLLTPIFFVVMNAVSRGCLAVAETYGSVLYYTIEYGDNYNASTVDPMGAAWFYTALGAGGVVVFIGMDYFTHYLSELTLLCLGFISMTVGFFTVLDWDHDLSIYNLAFSMGMIYILATPITQTLVASMLSKALPKQQQGRWMGTLTAGGSIGRIVFPLLSGVLYQVYNTSTGLLLPATVTMMSVFITFLGWKLYRPWISYWQGVAERLKQSWKEEHTYTQHGNGALLPSPGNDGRISDLYDEEDAAPAGQVEMSVSAAGHVVDDGGDDDDDSHLSAAPWLTIEQVVEQRSQQR